MDIYSYIKKDHQKVADLFEQALSTKSIEKRKSLFNEIANELSIHADSENDTFYKALRNNPQTEKLIESAEEEHEEIKEYIAKLKRLSIEGEKWIEQFGEFKHSVTHHVKEEEEDIFEEAKKVLTKEQAMQLSLDMDALKQELKKKLKAV